MDVLSQWGWNSFFESQLTDEEKRASSVARIVEPSRGLSRAVCAIGEVWAETSGAVAPVVGDWIVGKLREHGAGEKRFSVDRTLARRNKLSRSAPGGKGYEQVLCANIDTVFVTIALTQEFQPRSVQSYLEVIEDSQLKPVIWVTKSDEGQSVETLTERLGEIAPGIPTYFISVHQQRGLESLAGYFSHSETIVLLGASGAGKSTLTNYLLSTEAQRVSDVRESDQKGRHTTTGRKLHLLPTGGMLIDSPGIREIQKWVAEEKAPEPTRQKKKSNHSRSRRASQEED